MRKLHPNSTEKFKQRLISTIFAEHSNDSCSRAALLRLASFLQWETIPSSPLRSYSVEERIELLRLLSGVPALHSADVLEDVWELFSTETIRAVELLSISCSFLHVVCV